jgi:hypothetical protein
MMGHTIDIYHVVQMNTIEYLHNVYGASGLAITPNMQTSKIDALKEIISAWGLNPRRNPHQKSHVKTSPNYRSPTKPGEQPNKDHMRRIKDRNQKGIKIDMTFISLWINKNPRTLH